MGRRFLAAVIGAALLGFAGSALAQSVCSPLEARLAALQRGDAGNEARYQQADAALRRARGEYDAAYRDARRLGCMGGLFARENTSSSCSRVMGGLQRADANLRRLQAERDRNSYNPRDLATERRSILQALANNRCGAQYEEFASRPERRPRGLFAELFGGDDEWRDNDDDFFEIPKVDTYRTICVRSCDGYFFPISFATIRAHFGQDELACQSMCPGSEVSLYTYRNPGGDPADAVSLGGHPYSALPTAFAYRETYNPSCSCHTAGAVAANYTPVDPAALAARAGPTIPVPVPRPHPGEDPETIANRTGSFTPRPVAPPHTDAVAGISGDRGVRLIGPAYYYAQ